MPSNRASLLTPLGTGAIAVVRIAGENVQPFLSAHFSKPCSPGRCVHGEIRDGQRILDDAVIVLLPGANAADLNLHGGVWVVQSILDLLARQGFALDPTSDLPLPLEQVDGASLLEREVLAHLPLARTRQALDLLLAQTNAWNDYVRRRRTQPTLHEIVADRTLWWMLHPPAVAIIGAPNVGKSTIANQLFAQERSITADFPGTTRDWVGEEANIDGLVVTLVDTPGVRETPDQIEQLAIDRSSEVVRRADLVVLVLDASGELEAQKRLLHQFPDALTVLNKMDRARVPVETGRDATRTVATTGEGLDALRLRICQRFAPDFAVGPKCWTLRQREVLSRAAAGAAAVGEVIGS